MKITKKLIILTLILFILFLGQFALKQATLPVYAESLWDEQEGLGDGTIGEAFGGDSSGESKDIRLVVVDIINIFLGFLGIIFLVLLILAGFKYMTSQGNEEKITEAISQIKTAIIGLIIILFAYSIAHFVTKYLLQATTGSVW